MSNKFNLGDKVETIVATNETELKHGPYAWAHGRDLTGEFTVKGYCGSGNGAVRIAPVNPETTAPFVPPIWVHESELKLAGTMTPVIKAIDPTPLLTTTDVSRKCQAGDVIECVRRVSALIEVGKEYTVEEHGGRLGFYAKGKFYFEGASLFKVVKLAEEATPTPAVEEIILTLPECPDGIEGPKGEVGTKGDPVIDIHNTARVKFGADKDLGLALVKAAFEGKQMQYFCEWEMVWENCDFPTFHVDNIYRVKPELTPAQQRVIELQAEIAELQANM